MSPNDRYRLRHMAEAAEAALQFVQGRRREDLDHDRQLVMALTRAVEIVGEAATQVSAAGRTELPDIPWAQITGMRNRLVHAYFDVDLDILWDTVELALPPLLAKLQRALKDNQ
ncbi:MAG: HepT-like ribonuclease domain-containing protein [Gammaproteobacteria bacterium]|nr:HepT-like ribonuclease domain-containing protein [Gammaproteobacteria bacterium]